MHATHRSAPSKPVKVVALGHLLGDQKQGGTSSSAPDTNELARAQHIGAVHAPAHPCPCRRAAPAHGRAGLHALVFAACAAVGVPHDPARPCCPWQCVLQAHGSWQAKRSSPPAPKHPFADYSPWPRPQAAIRQHAPRPGTTRAAAATTTGRDGFSAGAPVGSSDDARAGLGSRVCVSR